MKKPRPLPPEKAARWEKLLDGMNNGGKLVPHYQSPPQERYVLYHNGEILGIMSLRELEILQEVGLLTEADHMQMGIKPTGKQVSEVTTMPDKYRPWRENIPNPPKYQSKVDKRLRQTFEALFKVCWEQTAHYSSPEHLNTPAYKAMVDLYRQDAVQGTDVCLDALYRYPHIAMSLIWEVLGEFEWELPEIPKQSRGRIKQIAQILREWGDKNDFLTFKKVPKMKAPSD